jgi:hypothetical protein
MAMRLGDQAQAPTRAVPHALNTAGQARQSTALAWWGIERGSRKRVGDAMAWQRGKYYVKNKRIGCQVVTEYIGCGEVADLIAELDALDRQRRQFERDMHAAERVRYDDPPELLLFFSHVDALVTTVLESAGYHRHKRQWRLRRAKKES